MLKSNVELSLLVIYNYLPYNEINKKSFDLCKLVRLLYGKSVFIEVNLVVYDYLKKHEAHIQKLLLAKEPQNWSELKCYHKTQIEFMQHERLIHLLVTLAFAFYFLGAVALTIVYSEVALMLVAFLLGFVELFYIIHLFKLENGVQRMYGQYNAICEREQS